MEFQYYLILQASKESVLRQIGEAECVHLATHVSWKLSAIVLSPGEVVDSQHSKARTFYQGQGDHTQVEEDCSEVLNKSTIFLLNVIIIKFSLYILILMIIIEHVVTHYLPLRVFLTTIISFSFQQ